MLLATTAPSTLSSALPPTLKVKAATPHSRQGARCAQAEEYVTKRVEELGDGEWRADEEEEVLIDQEYEAVALAQGAGNLDVDDSMRYVMERVLGATGGYPLPHDVAQAYVAQCASVHEAISRGGVFLISRSVAGPGLERLRASHE